MLTPAFAEVDSANFGSPVKEAPVVETYKLKGQVEFNDNPVETIYLDETIDIPQINIPKKILKLPVGMLNITSNANTQRSALARSVINRGVTNEILPLTGSLYEQLGGFSYGQTWEQEVSYSQLESTTAFFVRYDSPKWFSFTAAARRTADMDIGKQYGAFRITPELHLTKCLTLKDSFTSYIDLPKNKNGVTLVYTPSLKKYADSLKLELSLAQSYYQDGKQSSEISFTTGFKL